VYKSTADHDSGKILYDRYSAVDDEFLALRKTVLARKTPRRMFVQAHTSLTGKHKKTAYRLYTITSRGVGLLPYMGYIGICGPKGCGFGTIWSAKGYVFQSGLQLGILFTRNYFSASALADIVDFLKCLGEWKPCLVSCGHILELCTNFRGLRCGIDLCLRSEIGYGVRAAHPDQKLWGVLPPGVTCS